MSQNFLKIRRCFSPSSWSHIIQFSSPVLRSLLLYCSRNGPLSDTQLKEQQLQSFQKEYDVLSSTPKPQRIHFSSLLDDRDDESIIPELPQNPTATAYVKYAIKNWVERVCLKPVIYPKLSSKSVSHKTRDICTLRDYPNNYGISSNITQVDLERIYHYFHDKVGGENEMRQVYYPSQFSPRTYYSSGGLSFHKTKFIGRLLTLLCEQLPPSSRRTRNLPNRLFVDEDEYALIYDFSSYTTNLWEHSSFFYWLARCVDEVDVCVMDAYDGPISVSLSSLINDCEDMHVFPKISVREYIVGCVFPIITNHVAGLLGIMGNIPSAVFLHASIGMQAIDTNHTNKINTPGDDGIILTTKENETRVVTTISTIGEFQMEKVYRSIDTGCLHLKKTIVQVANTLITMPNVVLPSVEYMINDEDVDPRYYKQINKLTKDERRAATASTITSFLKSLRSVDIGDDDECVILTLLDIIYTWYNLPRFGNVPQFLNSSQSYFCCAIPSQGYDFRVCPITYTIQHNNSRVSRLPMRDRIEPTTDLSKLGIGDVFVSNGTQLTTYLEKLGYLDKKVKTECVFNEEVYDRTIYEYTHYHPYCVYEFLVLNTPPYFLLQMDNMC